MRTFWGIVCFIVSQWVLQYLPISIAFVIQQAQPFFTAILAYFMLAQAIGRREIILMIISYLGILVIADSKPSESENISNKMYKFSCLVQLMVAIGYSL
jgi:drug/metabolite transporter (DMT)-like permease